MVPNFKREEQIVKKARNWIVCLLLISGMITVFNSPLTDFLIESYRPVVQATNNSKTTPEDWSDVQLVNLFSVAKARVSHPEVHVIGAVYNEKMHLNTPIANGVDNTIFSLCAGTLKPHEKWDKVIMYWQLIMSMIAVTHCSHRYIEIAIRVMRFQ